MVQKKLSKYNVFGTNLKNCIGQVWNWMTKYLTLTFVFDIGKYYLKTPYEYRERLILKSLQRSLLVRDKWDCQDYSNSQINLLEFIQREKKSWRRLLISLLILTWSQLSYYFWISRTKFTYYYHFYYFVCDKL